MRESVVRTGFPIQNLSFRIIWFAVLAAVFMAFTAVPFPVAAQQSTSAAPAATTGNAAQPEAAGSQEESKPEANEEDVYLHAPAVKAIAKLLHLSLDATVNLFEGINFAIIVFGIGIPLFRWLPKFLRNRKEKVHADIETAKKASEEASERLKAIETKLSGLGGEIAVIRARVEEESKEDEARIKSTIAEESARIVAAAEQEVEATAAMARRSLQRFAAELAIEQAIKDMKITPETDQALIAEFLTGVDAKPVQQGGQK